MSELGSVGNENEKTVKDRIIESGIAQRMLDTIKKYKDVNAPEITFGVQDCDFRVEEIVEKKPNNVIEKHLQVIIEMPNPRVEYRSKEPRVTQAFGVENGKSFGAYGESPLTENELDLVKSLLTINNSLKK